MALTVYNSLTRKKEPFTPLNPPRVAVYVCGPGRLIDAVTDNRSRTSSGSVVRVWVKRVRPRKWPAPPGPANRVDRPNAANWAFPWPWLW